MATDEKTRSNITSTTLPGGRTDYPTVEELANGDGEKFKHLTAKLTKVLLGLLEDTIQHLLHANPLFESFLKYMKKSMS